MNVPPTAEDVRSRAEKVRERIVSAGGDLRRVRVVAVTKGFGVATARAALDAGLADLGENYASELVTKAVAVAGTPPLASGAPVVRWHFLGGLQRNKIARIAPHVALWQGVDRIEELQAIATHAPGAAVLVEVSTSDGAGRGGVPAREVARLVEAAVSLGLDVRGLMTVAPPLERGRPAVERAFSEVRALIDELGLAEASMGMSADLDLAVAHGSTMVRVGTALFGSRPLPLRVSQ